MVMKVIAMTGVGGMRARRARRRDRVITTATPRMTAENPTNAKPRATQRAVKFDGLQEIIRAGRLIAAAGGGACGEFEHGIEKPLVKADGDADGGAKNVRHHGFLRDGGKGPGAWPV